MVISLVPPSCSPVSTSRLNTSFACIHSTRDICIVFGKAPIRPDNDICTPHRYFLNVPAVAVIVTPNNVENGRITSER